MLANQPNGTLYTGMTNDIFRRIWEHKNKSIPGFASKYGVDKLVWFEQHETLDTAFRREKQIKRWKRLWKIQLIERDNLQWIDLYPSLAP
jgi:putative endonuclease